MPHALESTAWCGQGEKNEEIVSDFGGGLAAGDCSLRSDDGYDHDRQACGNTSENMSKAESKEIPLISEAKVVKSGVVRVMELQEQGWTYVKP